MKRRTRHLARPGIDVDDADVGAEREREVGRVVDRHRRRGGPRRPRAARPPRAPRARSPGSSCSARGRPSPTSGLSPTRGRPARPRASRPRSAAPCRAPCARRSPPPRRTPGVEREPVGPQPERRLVGVAVHDLDVLGRDAELLGDDLRERRLVALALGLARTAGSPPCPVGCTRSSQPSAMPSPTMSIILRGPAPTVSVKNDRADAHQLAARALFLLLARAARRSRPSPAPSRAPPGSRPSRRSSPSSSRTGTARAGAGSSPQLRGVHVELGGEHVDHPLDQVDGLGDPERARVGDAARRLVRVHAA